MQTMTVAAMGMRPAVSFGFFDTLVDDQIGNEEGGNNSEVIAVQAVEVPTPVGNVTERTETSPRRTKVSSSPTKTENSTAQENKSTSGLTNKTETKTETKTEKSTAPKAKDTTGEDKKNNGTSTNSHREPESENYGDRWEWSLADVDYVRIDEKGVKHLYTDYQKPPDPEVKAPPIPKRALSDPKPKPTRPKWKAPLDDRFQVVSKPKRFFAVPLFHGERPLAKFRWFVVVRRRLHHSLCFSITTYAGDNRSASNKTARGRDVDFVVLHLSNVEPARPYEEENITRKPIAVIIEDQETFISPFARLDCGRVYTVEDNLRVMKVGRVHPGCLVGLEEYFRDSVS
ncbi:hypothetical protein B0T21DRAFT_414070 [Apiosordaria backusii]|uniref:DUF6590 domain-containing protein n=1 Tax=Apiosordaria backusii TaxID=314023 RepID=A0AA40AXC6_9PEZI|nr:hypothetical protein B0T21DRAFT_414070 [Apiosordaria backusii]